MTEHLSNELLEIVTKNLPQDQKAFVEVKWPQILHYACQNAGLKKWGSHIQNYISDLKKSVASILNGIEMIGFRVWKPQTQDDHLEVLFRLFFDDNISVDDVNFTNSEKLAFFWEYDSAIIAQFRSRFEKIFSDLYQEMVWTQHDPFVTHMLIGNLIALYPYFDPPIGHEVRLLQHINQEWQMVTYCIEHISLVEDEIHAVGLIPTAHQDAYPILIFRGTPYPAAKGFWKAVFSDLHPFRSVGEDLYQAGKKNIHLWMEGKPHIKCYGMSLGGALCYHLGKEYGKRATVHAYVPPGIYFTKKDRNRVEGVAYFHADDLVKAVGYHPTGENFKCYALLTESNRNFLLAHARPVGCNPTVVLVIDPVQENRRLARHLLTALKHVFSAIFSLVAWPIYLIRRYFR
ncbi:MAG TPA: hypothetical protein PKW79_04110 [Rhabdochlamydiaceae bacterium]|nr:hypothetical protein [Rhabdochlamydiaceae bacterium]